MRSWEYQQLPASLTVAEELLWQHRKDVLYLLSAVDAVVVCSYAALIQLIYNCYQHIRQ